MRLGYKQFMVFLGCKILGSRIAFILISTPFLSFIASIEMPHTFKALSLCNNTTHTLILEISLLLFYFILAIFTYCFLTQFPCGCHLSYHNYHHSTPSPKFWTNFLRTMMLSYKLRKGRRVSPGRRTPRRTPSTFR